LGRRNREMESNPTVIYRGGRSRSMGDGNGLPHGKSSGVDEVERKWAEMVKGKAPSEGNEKKKYGAS
jgi:hypothetical protein